MPNKSFLKSDKILARYNSTNRMSRSVGCLVHRFSAHSSCLGVKGASLISWNVIGFMA